MSLMYGNYVIKHNVVSPILICDSDLIVKNALLKEKNLHFFAFGKFGFPHARSQTNNKSNVPQVQFPKFQSVVPIQVWDIAVCLYPQGRYCTT